jgi:hypothetical protein
LTRIGLQSARPAGRSVTMDLRLPLQCGGMSYMPTYSARADADRDYYDTGGRDEAASWFSHRQAAALAEARVCAVHAAQRVSLADRRCQELNDQIERLAARLSAVPAGVSQGDVHAVEESKLRLEERLHKERHALWKDLQPLASAAKDAAVESMRAAWVNELARTLDASGGGA